MSDPRLSEATPAELAEAFAARLNADRSVWELTLRLEHGHLRSVVAQVAVTVPTRVTFGRRALDSQAPPELPSAA